VLQGHPTAEDTERPDPLTDPDACAMATSTNRGLVGYNVQTAMDARHYLIVAHEVCQRWRQLIKMAKQTQAVMEPPELKWLPIGTISTEMKSWPAMKPASQPMYRSP
jgi:hypothetical protein